MPKNVLHVWNPDSKQILASHGFLFSPFFNVNFTLEILTKTKNISKNSPYNLLCFLLHHKVNKFLFQASIG